ncbi:MAG: hypothetical protein K2X47_06040, partial [Bdellovibrionales bacterium]|nr:hypothetical protein [Bdellovibrionales bacterium]
MKINLILVGIAGVLAFYSPLIAKSGEVPEVTVKMFLEMPLPAQMKLINGYQTFVTQVQWEAGAAVDAFVDGDYAMNLSPSLNLFPKAWALGRVCAPLSQKTCVVGGNLSEMRERFKNNEDGEPDCIGYFCSKQGFSQGCAAGEVRCNPLLFVNAEGKSFCEKISAPLGVTYSCQM